MNKLLLILLCLPMIGFGQKKPRDGWSNYEKNKCIDTHIEGFKKINLKESLIINILSTSDNNEQFMTCICDQLEKQHPSLYEVSMNITSVKEIHIPCFSSLLLKNAQCIKGDCLNNFGKIVFDSGESYEGDFRDGQMHGDGTFLFKDGSKYIGDFSHSSRGGKGTYYMKNGDIYIGEWKNNIFHGEGRMSYHTGDIYVGAFKNGYENGYGTFFDANGGVYKGEFKDGLMHGNGIETNNGIEGSGTWKNHKRHGEFILKHLASGEEMRLTFVDGVAQ